MEEKPKNEVSIEDLKQLPGVGETTARVLKEEGYNTFESLVGVNPVKLQNQCDNTVLSATTHIISAAVDHINGECPECNESDFSASWQEYSKSQIDGEIVCEECSWYGNTDDLK